MPAACGCRSTGSCRWRAGSAPRTRRLRGRSPRPDCRAQSGCSSRPPPRKLRLRTARPTYNGPANAGSAGPPSPGRALCVVRGEGLRVPFVLLQLGVLLALLLGLAHLARLALVARGRCAGLLLDIGGLQILLGPLVVVAGGLVVAFTVHLLLHRFTSRKRNASGKGARHVPAAAHGPNRAQVSRARARTRAGGCRASWGS